MDKRIYGNKISQKIKDQLKIEVDHLKQTHQRIPHLVVIVVGQDEASKIYVRNKEKACEYVGFQSTCYAYEQITTKALCAKIEELNHDHNVDGILVQMPLPNNIDSKKVIEAIAPHKDVDGFHPYNVGKLAMNEKGFVPCTPKGIMHLLEHVGYCDLSGYHAVVVGRSHLVGKPIAQLLLNQNATVTICHSKTKDIQHIVKQGDIVIVAIGKAKMVTKEWLKEGAVVIDVGINRLEQGICGDVDTSDVMDVVKYITPVPKGVGPMTIAMLLMNTKQAYEIQEGQYEL